MKARVKYLNINNSTKDEIGFTERRNNKVILGRENGQGTRNPQAHGKGLQGTGGTWTEG